MKIAIHHRPGSFSDLWIEYCEKEYISYKLVDCYRTDIVQQIRDCDALLWHHNSQSNFKDSISAKRILFALEQAGINVFPDFNSGWHFDDKVGQKYLLEAIGAPLVASYIFYDKDEAMNWIETTTFPKVFKLAGGSGSKNVLLIKSKKKCKKLIKIAFGKGFNQKNIKNQISDDILRFKKFKNPIDILKAIARPFIKSDFAKKQKKEKGYLYMQDFIPNNKYDIRVVIVNGKAAAEKRFVRKNDFRASGSGDFDYKGVNKDVISLAFKIAQKLRMKSIAFDFIFDKNNQPLIVEMSYVFGTAGIRMAPGYWDSDLKWYEKEFKPQEFIIKELLEEIKNRKNDVTN